MADLVNLKEASTELRISIYALRSWISQKRLPCVRLGRRVLLRREDIEEFVNKNVVEAKEGNQ